LSITHFGGIELRQHVVGVTHLLKHRTEGGRVNLTALIGRGLQQTLRALKDESQLLTTLSFRAFPHLVSVTGHVSADLPLSCKVASTAKGRHCRSSITTRQGITSHTTSARLGHHLLLVEAVRQRIGSRVRIDLH